MAKDLLALLIVFPLVSYFLVRLLRMREGDWAGSVQVYARRKDGSVRALTRQKKKRRHSC